ncbi:hypothetical protein FNH22_17310 [Fulvivirga sp. M361]|uniref:fibronectin type III domain-containing protein n=1 Tax=Fulvivirga sp. M361 TaxID=2594266 RepID=UPI00117AC0CD|nr:fibronectin type III domain-containing protein [Fulvivirga sp. M361]TRX56136.1 hypothetical protein FNH22_17310 [Fulvivirga sp. M361]
MRRNKLIYPVLFCLLLTSAALAQPANDNSTNAEEIVINTYCSATGAFTTVGATPDGLKPNNWSNGPNSNVWFKFQATTTEVAIHLTPDGMSRPKLALHGALLAELVSVNDDGATEDIGLSWNTLVVGAWYFINVSNGSSSGNNGAFLLCVDDAVSQDYPAGAVEISHTSNQCSALAAYQTRIGTPDGARPSKWSNGPNANVWFKFQATTAEVALSLKVKDAEGTLLYPKLALYDASITELVSVNDDGATEDIGLSHTNLTIGAWYYVNVDNGNNRDHRGTFTLCVDTRTTHDYSSQAVVLTNVAGYCTSLEEYTTRIATPDGSRPSNWNNGPNANVWFTFQALGPGVTIGVKTDGVEGSLRYPKVALHASTLTELASRNDAGATTDIELIHSGLIIGDWYYINVDNATNQSQRGTFTLCVDNPSLLPSVPGDPVMSNVTSSSAQLDWVDNSANETGFELYRATVSGGPYSLVTTTGSGVVTHTDTGLSDATSYYYVVRAINAHGNSSNSSEVVALTSSSSPSSPQTLRILAPLASGPASSQYFPIQFGFDGPPTWDDANQTPTGGSGGSDAPGYNNRTGYIDFGPDYADLRIISTWTQYRPNSPGDHMPYAAVWWDDDNDDVNDNGITTTAINFNTAQGLANLGSLLWVRDMDHTNAPVTPQRRYLVLRSADPMTGRAREYAMVGYSASVEGNLPDHLELQALRDLYEGTNGANWTNNTGWPTMDAAWDAITSVDQLTGWHGITVENGDLSEIVLNDNNLDGNFPIGLITLKALNTLNMGTNHIIGTIPEQINSLESIEFIDLSNNSLTGSIPLSLETLPLKHLFLSGNQMSGEIPDYLFQKTSLIHLSLTGNQFTGTLPNTLNLPWIEYIDIGSNMLSGEVPSSISTLGRLKRLTLSSNNFEGDFPPFDLAGQVYEMNLENNQFTSIPYFDRVDELRVQGNALTFESLEAQFTDGTPPRIFTYAPQKAPLNPIVLNADLNEPYQINNNRSGGNQTTYTWQEWDGTNWANINGETTAQLNISNVIIGDDGRRLRCEMINSTFPGLVIYSEEYELNVIISQTFYVIASGNWSDPMIWSLTEGGAPENRVPTEFDKIQLANYQVEVTKVVDCRSVRIDAGPGTTLKISGQQAALNVNGQMVVDNISAIENKILQVLNGGKLECR